MLKFWVFGYFRFVFCIKIILIYEYDCIIDRMNFWGYLIINFFLLMIWYVLVGNKNCGKEVIKEFKLLVREVYKFGMEVRFICFICILIVLFELNCL